MNFNKDFISKFDKCLPAEKNKYLSMLCKKYHIQPKLSNEILAVNELAFRLVYEVLIGKLSYDAAIGGRWSKPNQRDPGHQIRIKKLQCYIRKSERGMAYASTFGWLQIK